MKMQRLLSGIVLMCGMAGAVQADTLISGPAAASSAQNQVACVVVNAGSAPINFIQTTLLGHYMSPLPQNFNDCKGNPLQPGATCTIQAATVPPQTAACKVIISESKTNVRGTMVSLIRRTVNGSFVDTVVSASDLR